MFNKIAGGGNGALREKVDLIFSQRSFIMGVSMIAIMLFHWALSTTGWERYLFEPFRMCGHFGVDMFLFLSGMGIGASLQKNSIPVYFRNRFLRLFPAWILVILVTYLVDNHGEPFHLQKLLRWFLHLWFLDALLVYYTLAPALPAVIRRFGLRGVLLLMVVLTLLFGLYACECFPFDSTRYTGGAVIARFPVFVLGIYVVYAAFDEVLTKWVFSWRIPLLLAFFSLIARCWYLYADESMALSPSDPYDINYLSFLFIAFLMAPLSVALARLGQYMKNKGLHMLVVPFGVLSLELYLWHEWLYSYVARWATSAMLRLPVLALAIALSLLLAWLTHCGCGRFAKIVSFRRH